MPVPKLKLSSTADAMKHDEGNDSLDTLIRQAIGKEPFLSFSRAGDSPLQWIQLLHALDQQDLPGWPLLSPLKMQMQKCEKCSREFCSTINYRRHMRLHRRNLNLDKDSTMKTKDLLRGFWDKLGADEAMEILSFKDVYLEEVTGSSIIKALTSFIRIASIPHSYVKAGSALLDIVQAGPSRFPVLSADLFSILDDASERTFLCAGTAESLQKYVFDGEAGKIGLEMRNLVACTSFLVEQKLVKAWVADKDAEALRYQKLLVEEEEAAQRRQAALLEKKRQKKLRLKEQKAKEHANGEIADSPEDISSMDSPPDPSVSSPFEASDSSLDIPDIPDDQTLSSSERDRVLIMEEDANTEPQSCLDTGYPDSGAYQNVEHRIFRRNGRRNLVNSRWHASKLQRVHNGFPGSHSHQVTKLGIMQKHSSYHDQKTANAANVYKIWTPKPKSETNEENYKTRLQIEPEALPDQNKTPKVIIGSISIVLRGSSTQQRDKSFGSGPRNYGLDAAVEKNSSYEKPVKCDAVQGIANRSTVKLWRPVSRENGSSIPVRNGSGGSEVDDVACKDGTQILGTSPTYCNCNECEDSLGNGLDEVARQEGVRFSRRVAEAFLSQRWKEAIASDHVRLVLFPEAEPPGDPAIHDDSQAAPPSEVSQCDDQGHTQNNSAGFVSVEPSASAKPKTKLKPDKGTKVKYIPKQKS